MQLDSAGFKELGKIKSKSNSNEDIELIIEGQNFYVKKIWYDCERGNLATKKQITFDEIRINSLIIRSPKIFQTQMISNSKFEAIMEYVEGNSGSDIALIGSRKVSVNIKNALSTLINNNLENSKIRTVENNVFIQKIDSIIEKIDSDNEFIEILKDLKKEFKIDNYLEIPLGPCHGDLTLSNIIISSSGALNLIDFLPTFIESPLWDIVKLNQDLEYGWSYRNLKGPKKASAKLFFHNCIPSQLQIFKKVFKREILLFDSLNLARICPYIKGKSDRFWLLKHIKQSLKELS